MTREEMMELRAMMKEVVAEETAEIKQDIADIKQVQRNSAVFEADMERKVGILLDGIKGIQDRFDRQDATERRVDDLEDRVSAIEYSLKK